MSKRSLGAGIMLGAYNVLYRAACYGVAPAVRAGALGAGWRWEERMGRYPSLKISSDERRIWVHAASVGEAKAAAVLVGAIRRRLPGTRFVVSTLTPAGFEAAKSAIPAAEAVVQAPVDLSGPVRRALSWFDPALFVIVETEIWPTLILECHRRGTPLAIASAKISSRSYGRYRCIRTLMRHVLSGVSCVGAQTDLDRERLCSLGLDPSRVDVTGDLKLDARGDAPAGARGRDEPEWLSLLKSRGDFLFAAGSTRPGEEEAVGKALLEIRGRLGGRVTAIVAPRHIDRCPAVARRLRGMGLDVVLRSALCSGGRGGRPGPEVLVLDTLGELGGVYPHCDAAFVGGTLAPHGGHNVAEPAAAGVPVLFGPSVESVRTVTAALVKCGGGTVVSGPESLARELTGLVNDPVERARRGAAAARAVESLRGAADRTLDFFERRGLLPPRGC